MMDTVLIIAVVALVAIGAVTILFLLRQPIRRPDAATTEIRDLMIAQNRALSGRASRPGEPEWDGIRRAPVDDDPGGGY